jgi:hypothetical protein
MKILPHVGKINLLVIEIPAKLPVLPMAIISVSKRQPKAKIQSSKIKSLPVKSI